MRLKTTFCCVNAIEGDICSSTTFCCVNAIEGDICSSTTQGHHISSSYTTNSLMYIPVIKTTSEVGVALPRDM